MASNRGPARGDFSDREITILGLMMQRRGANTWPDSDRQPKGT